MANNVSLPHVLVLDTTADNIVAAAVGVRIRKLRLVSPAGGNAQITDAGGSVNKLNLAALANGSDTLDFYASPFNLNGLKLTISPSASTTVLYVYTEQA
jgi:hypothetical protein